MEPNLHKLHYINNHYKTNTPRFADNQAVIADSEDKLQRGVFTLQNIENNFGMVISSEKSETKAILGHTPVRCKILVDNKCLQQVKNI
jgi:uncharacterized membrane protein (UPF0127 family)